MQWTEPYWTVDPACNAKGPSEGSTWVGVGPYRLKFSGGVSNPENDEALGQDGTIFGGGQKGSVHPKWGGDRFFWETLSREELSILPQYDFLRRVKSEPRSVPYIHGGYTVDAKTVVNKRHNRWLFSIWFLNPNRSKLVVRSYYQVAKGTKTLVTDRSAADFIVERQPPNHTYPVNNPLGDFGTWTPSRVIANGNVKGASNRNFANNYFESVNHSETLQDIGPIKAPWPEAQNYWNSGSNYYLATVSSTTTGFQAQWQHCL